MDSRQHTKREKELKRERIFLRNIMATIPDSLLILDRDLRIKSANRSFYKLFQTEPEKIMGSKIADVLEDRDGKLSAQLARLFGTEDMLENFELHYQPEKSGERIFNITARGMIVAEEEEEEEEEEELVVLQDITERKKAKEDLIRLSNAVKMSTDSIVVSDLEGNIIEANEATLKMYGTDDKGDLIGRNSFDLIAPEDREKAFAGMEEAMERGYTQNREYHIITKDGSKIPAEMSVALMKDADGKAVGFVGVSRDITERKQAEEALRESESRYRLLAENVTDVIWTMDMNLRLTYISPSIKYLRGYSTEEAVGQTLEETLTPASLDVARKTLTEELAIENMEQKDLFRSRMLELEQICKDGSIIWTEAKMTFLRDPDGQPVGILGITRSITERKKAEEALREGEKRYRTLFESKLDGMFVIDAETMRIVLVNQAAAEMYGFSSVEETIGINPLDFVASEEGERTLKIMVADMFEKDLQEINEFRTMTKDGEEKWISAVGARIEYEGKLAGLVSFRDITEQKRAEQALRESEQRLGIILQNSPIPAFVIDKNHKVIYWNAALEQCTGIKAEQVIGTEQHWKAFYNEKRPCMADLLVDDAVKEILQWYVGGHSKSKVVEGAYEATDFFPTLGEGGKWLRFTAAVIRDSKGNLFGAMETLEDITERKQAEELYETLTNSPQVGVFVIQDGKIQFTNPYVQQYSGFSPNELLGKDPLSFVHPEDREIARENAVKMLEGERSSPYEFRIVTKDGHTRWVVETVASILHKGKRAALANQIDITEMKRAQEALEESEEKYRTLFEDSRDAVYTVTREGKLVDANQSFSDLFGYTREEIMKLQIQKLYVSLVDRERFRQEIEQRGSVRDYELKFHKKDGAEMDCLATSTVWKDKEGSILGYRGIIRDITERKKAEEQLKRSFIDLAETVSRAMGSRDPYTANHQQKVAQLARLIGEKMELDKDRLQGLYIGGLLHDVGKISIPASILTKPGKLSDEEWTLIRAHAKQGYNILNDTNLPWPIADMALHHHERLDGSGYPHGLKSDELSLENCILSVCDVVEAMSSYRPYRPARSKKDILEEIKGGRGTKYNADVVDVMLQIIENEEFEFGWEGGASAATKDPKP